ncbi:hypothetical protein FB567DRAFT_591727 [Paraphoma chrysanthemicola]|uniref:Uncharacterized protein n=1 Tax=Paraphoma chrysanthemicola TaxID=798071 RepID=A0A8K0R5T7_9PLEO|nr:hypothetical protein FB567DRAFT_591727 [Paraphoma chrysanthemicola]
MPTSSQGSQEAYETVSLPDNDDLDMTTSGPLATDSIELLHSNRSAWDSDKNVPACSLSRDERKSWYFMGHGAVDAFMTLGPVLFLVVPGMCLGLNNRPISGYGETVKAITLLSPTIFPIIYAGILGKLLRRIGLFRAERGTTLGNLERLIGCQSISSTLERQITLRIVDALGVAILLAWLLSPVGGQASLRLLSTKPFTSDHTSSVRYYPMQEYPQRSYILSADLAQKKWPLYGPLYMTAVQTSRQSLLAPMDLYGYVKVPDIAYLNQGHDVVTSSDYDWHLVGNNTLASYTSIFGVPVVDLPTRGNYSFYLVSHYWAVQCHSLRQLQTPPVWPPAPSSNSSRPARGTDQSPTFHIRVDEGNSTDGNITFEYSSMQHQPYEGVKVTVALCSTSPVVVESRVQCHDRSCAVRALRNMKTETAEIWRNATQKESPALSIFRSISEWMPGADLGYTQGVVSTSELIEHWMVDTDLSTLENATHPYIDFVLQLPRANFSRRLQTAINTFWDASLGSGTRLNVSQRAVDTTNWTHADTVVTRGEGDVYVCNMGLAVITIMIALAMFAAANISLLLGLITRAPDTLGYVSSSASNNPHFKRYAASSLSGMEVSRALRDVKVRVGDVKSEETIGHIALATLDANPKKLSWTRLYD